MGTTGRVPDLVLAASAAKDELMAVIVTFGPAPNAAAVSPEHSHEEGGVTVELEVKSASLTEATRAGKRLPAVCQRHVPGSGNFHLHPRSPAATTVRLEP